MQVEAAILDANILIVDDLQTNVTLLDRVLNSVGYTHVTSTMRPSDVCGLHRKNHYDLILLDLEMPEVNGFRVMEELKADDSDSYLPVIALTARPAHKLRALQAGAKDFINKPFDLMELTTRIHNMLEVRLLYRRTEERNRTLKLQALHDSMTGLPNRTLFDERLGHAIALSKRHDWELAVMFLDIDRFKAINDTYGHAIGDGVLKSVAQRLSRHSREEDTACRNGGDEFLMLLINPNGRHNVGQIANLLLRAISAPIDLGKISLSVTGSIGVAMYPEHCLSGEQLIKNADIAMYRAKNRRNSFEIF